VKHDDSNFRTFLLDEFAPLKEWELLGGARVGMAGWFPGDFGSFVVGANPSFQDEVADDDKTTKRSSSLTSISSAFSGLFKKSADFDAVPSKANNAEQKRTSVHHGGKFKYAIRIFNKASLKRHTHPHKAKELIRSMKIMANLSLSASSNKTALYIAEFIGTLSMHFLQKMQYMSNDRAMNFILNIVHRLEEPVMLCYRTFTSR
jgi:hypothetical protein